MDVEPSTPLLYILRNDLGLRGPAVRLRTRPVRRVHGDHQRRGGAVVHHASLARSKGEITTLEGLATDGKLHPLQQAWIDEQVPQCGFCQNGQIMTAKALLDQNPHPTDAQIREGMARDAVPLHDVLPHPGRHQARGEVDRRCRGSDPQEVA